MSADQQEIEAIWAVTEREMERLSELKSSDRLLGTHAVTDLEGRLTGNSYAVFVSRHGEVSNVNHDGTIGVPEEIRELLSSEHSLYHPDQDGAYTELTARWIDVITTPDGAFVRESAPVPAMKS